MPDYRVIKTSTLNIIDPSQITTDVFDTDIHYYKVGKLYFGFYRPGALSAFLLAHDGATLARIALELGFTINTTYFVTDNEPGDAVLSWNVGLNNWQASAGGGVITYAILAN